MYPLIPKFIVPDTNVDTNVMRKSIRKEAASVLCDHSINQWGRKCVPMTFQRQFFQPCYMHFLQLFQPVVWIFFDFSNFREESVIVLLWL